MPFLPLLVASWCAVALPPSNLPRLDRDLERLARGDAPTGTIRALLPDGDFRLVHLDRTVGGPAWHFEHEARGASATVVRLDDRLSVVSRAEGRTVHAWIDRDGRRHRVELPGGLPCGGALEPPRRGATPQSEGGVAGCDGPERIDVLVVWSGEAEMQAENSGGILALVSSAEAAANAAYAASGIGTRIEVVLATLIDFPQSPNGMASDLFALTDPADGIADLVHPLRDAVAADMVAMIGKTDGSYCGIAFLLPANGPESQGSMFSVTAWNCLGDQVLAHELGHNMGCCHAPGDGGGCGSGGIRPYSVGHRFFGSSGQQFRTVMAYAPGVRIDRFSNPAVSFNGTPTGLPVPPDGSSGRDNARTINETMATIAAFRCSSTAIGLGDCDGNGAPDAFDLVLGRGSDIDADGQLDACQFGSAACPPPLAAGDGTAAVRLSLPVAAATGDRWGSAVAVQGTTLAVGAEGKSRGGQAFAGEVRVYRLSAAGPTLEASLSLPDPVAFDLFGAALALDGDLLAVGAPGRDPAGASGAGEVRIFRRAASGWAPWRTVTAPLLADGDRFGTALALADGWLVVGASGADLPGATDGGAVYAFPVTANGVGVPQVLRHPAPGASDHLGSALDLAGGTLVAGAPFRSAAGLWTGGLVVWDRTETGWTVRASFDGAESDGSPNLGRSVAIDGDRIFAGAPNAGNGTAIGAVRAFRRVGGGWQADGSVPLPSGANGLRFGSGLAARDGTLLVGTAPNDPARTATFGYAIGDGGPTPTGKAAYGSRPAIAGNLRVIGAPIGNAAGANAGGATVLRFRTDCDGNGIDDLCDLAAGAADGDGNGVPDACEAPPFGDLDGDFTVGAPDLAILLAAWGICGACPADLDGDGAVGATDLALLLAAWR